MTASPLPQTPRRSRPKTDRRQVLAFRAGEDVLDGSSHGVGLLLYYKYLVARAGLETSSLIGQGELARENGVSTRTIRRYDDHLVAAGLIWLKKEGHSYRRTITAYEPPATATHVETSAVPEVQAVEPDPFFSGPRSGQIDPVEADRSVRFPPFKENSINDQSEGLRPPTPQGGGTSRRRSGRSVRRDEPVEVPTTPATTLLQEHGVEDPETLRRLAGCDEALIRRTLAEIRARPTPPRSPPGFLVWRLDNRKPARAAPVETSAWSGEPAVEQRPELRSMLLPTVCPVCGLWCPADWEGRCYRCEPEHVEPAGGVS